MTLRRKHNGRSISVIGFIGCALTLGALSACQLRFPRPDLAQSDIETSLFLIGDAGEPDPRHPEIALDSMRAQAAVAPRQSVIVFLGDNIYVAGVPDSGFAEYADARRRLEAQVNAVPPGVKGIFLPGNHDWANTGPAGLYAIRHQERLISVLAKGRDVRMLPGNGCPGPVSLDIGRLRFIALDTQWWLQNYIVRDAESRCTTDVAGITRELRQQITSIEPGRVTVAGGHHPLMTGGEHGGYCGITGPFRRFGGHSQDILSSLNRTMRDSLESAFSAKPPIVYAAGHEHNLQVIKGAPNVGYLLVSGAGSISKVGCGVRLRESYYVSQHRTGFMRLDIMRGKGVLLRVYRYTSSGTGGLSYSRWLEAR